MARRRPLHIDVPVGLLTEIEAPDTVGADLVDLVELGASPEAPPEGVVRVYALSDHRLYRMDFTGTEVLLGEGGGGPCPPNPRDAYKLVVATSLAETNGALADASLVAFAFAESNAALLDTLLLGLSFADTDPVLADALTRIGVFVAESIATQSETAALELGYTETNAALTDTVRTAFGFADTAASQTDLFTALRVVIAEINAAQSETIVLRITHTESNAALTDALTRLALGLSESVATTSDLLTLLRMATAESNATLADAGTFVLRATYPETSPAQSEALTLLRIRPVPAEPLGAYGSGPYGALPYGGQVAPKGRLDEINGQVSDARSGQVRYWAQNASAVNSTGAALASGSSTTMAPANATGERNGTTATVRTNLSLGDTTNPVALLSSQFGPAALLLPPNVTSQRLRVYFSIPARTAGLDTITIQYRTDGVTNSDTGWTTIYTHTGTAAVNFLTTPFDWNLVPVLTQAQADALVMRVRYQASVVASPEAQVNLDAWALEASTAL